MQASRAQFQRHEKSHPANHRLSEMYREIRQTSLTLSRPFSAEDQMLQSMPDASPMKWHLAHTTWFFETFILSAKMPGYKPYDSRFKQLFNSYYKQLGSHPFRGTRGLMSRPTLEQVHAFREWVDDAMEEYIPRASAETLALIEVGLNHEQQHQELMVTDIKHALWSMPLRPEKISQPRAITSALPLRWLEFPEGIHQIGHSGDGFSFDNELPRHKVLLQSFQIASRQVTNGEYLDFIRDNGYSRPELWLSEGWDTVCPQSWNAPFYWEKRDSEWLEFTFSGLQEIDPAAPVCHVSYFEADAFARWAGARLPREEEWEVAAAKACGDDNFPSGQNQSAAVSSGEFLDSGKLHPPPLKGTGQQWFGNVWEWTASPYVAYPGFVPAEGLLGEYNGKFMCNQFVLRGGSCATPSSHIRGSYRNFFPPHARWQFMGLRLAK